MATYYCAQCLTTFPTDGEACSNLACGSRRPSAGWATVLVGGDLLDRHYRIERPLAVGGAGLTYLAREVDAAGVTRPPDLAIKVLYAARASGAFLRRLSTEAQVLQELDHPNIVQLRGFVHRTGQEPYLVTAFEHGGTLGQHVEQVGAISPRVSAAILEQILQALDQAHQRGVVHRDLKPDNVLLAERADADTVPHVRVADFGIAKVAGSIGKVTRHGMFVGTPEYAAPEQFDGMEPTPATDVFAAGALFLHLMTARPPIVFSQREDIDSCQAEWLAALPPKLERAWLRRADPVEVAVAQEILGAMMDVRPERRWTVQQVLARLEGLARGGAELVRRETLEITQRPAPRRHSLPLPPDPEVRRDSVPADPLRPPGEVSPTLAQDRAPSPDAPTDAQIPRLDALPPPILDAPLLDRARTANPTITEPDEPEEREPSIPPAGPAVHPLAGPVPSAPLHLQPEPEPAGRGGMAGCVAAIAGLGVMGAGGLVVAVIVVLALGGGVAWQAGLFTPTPVQTPDPDPDPDPNPVPVPVPVPDPQPGTVPDPQPGTVPVPTPQPGDPVPQPMPPRPTGAWHAPQSADGRAVQAALATLDLSACGPAVALLATATVDGRAVTGLTVDPGQVADTQARCVEAAARGTAVSSAPGSTRVAVR